MVSDFRFSTNDKNKKARSVAIWSQEGIEAEVEKDRKKKKRKKNVYMAEKINYHLGQIMKFENLVNLGEEILWIINDLNASLRIALVNIHTISAFKRRRTEFFFAKA